MKYSIYVLSFTLLLGCGQYWEIDTPGYRPQRIEIIKTPVANQMCRLPAEWNGAACVVRTPELAIIYIREGLSDRDYKCALGHEFKHVLGYGHPAGPVQAPDCGT